MLLANNENRQRFLYLLSVALTVNLCRTVRADGDPHCMIAAQALESSKTHVTVVVGEGTD